jgi:hypothetical protein
MWSIALTKNIDALLALKFANMFDILRWVFQWNSLNLICPLTSGSILV